jgi:zinc protease
MWLFLGWLACAPRLDPGPIQADAVSAPVRLVEMPDAASPNIYLQAIVAAGSAWDPPGREGLAHLTARALVDAGAGELSADGLRDALYPTGNAVEQVIDREWVSLRLRCHRDHAALCVERFADVLTSPRFEAADVERLRDDAVFEVTEGVLGDDEALGAEVFHSVLYEGHPYGHPVTGRAGALPTLTPELLRDFHGSHYVREAVVVGVAGGYEPAHVAALRARLEALPAQAMVDRVRLQPPTTPSGTLTIVSTSTPVTGFHLGHTVETDRDHADWPALYVGMIAFGAHRQSFGRLFRSIRASRGLNYGDYAYVEAYVQQGWEPAPENGVLRADNHFVMWIRPTSLENAPFALKLAQDELDVLLADGLGEDEFRDVVSHLRGAIPLLAKDPGRRLAYALDAAATGTPNLLEIIPAKLDTLTREEVLAAMQRHIKPEQMAIVAVSGDAEGLRGKLLATEPTPMVYADVKPDDAQAQRDVAVAARKVPVAAEKVVIVNAQGLFQ